MTTRGEERRTQVLEATLRLLAREGPRAVTHRAVAREAGTSLRATTYYFSSRDELLVQALVHYARTAFDRFDRLREPLGSEGGDDDPLEQAADVLASTVLSDLEEDRTGLVAEYELALEIGRRPELEPAFSDWQKRLEKLLAAYAGLLGSRRPELHARLVLATLRGLELEALAHPSRPPRREDLRGVFAELLRSLLASERQRG